MKIDFFKIRAASPLKHSHPGFDSFVLSMEKLVRETIPESVIELHETSHFIPIESNFERLGKALPILNLSEEEDAPCTLSLTVLTREEHTHGVGLFLCGMIAKKLFPGKKMPITFLRSLSFKFIVRPKMRYYIIEFFIEVESLKELYTIKKNFPRFEDEVRLTILGVEHARKVVLANKHSIEEKRLILSENLEGLLKHPSKLFENNLFHDVQTLVLKAMHDHNPNKIPDHILPYIDAKPETFDHMIYKEVEKLSILFHDSFASKRKLSHLSRTLSYLYLFRKIMSHSQMTPDEHHLSLKLLYTKVEEVPTLAVLVGMQLKGPSEVLMLDNVLSAIQSITPGAELLSESNVIDETNRDGSRLLYLEVQDIGGQSFKPEILKGLKKRLPKEIKKRIHSENTLSGEIDKEKIRSVLSLTKELRAVHDPAQAIIQYHNTREGCFEFSVVVARVRKLQEAELQISSSPPITVRREERKVAGILDQRFIKEVYLYDLTIQKEGRTIAEARRALFLFLKAQIPHLHDFSGGMVNRKYENLEAFKSILDNPPDDTLIESYFYSISPPYLQSLTPPDVLKAHFDLFLRALDRKFVLEQTHILKKEVQDYILLAIASPEKREVDEIKGRIPTQCDGVATAEVKVFDLYLLGFILPKSEKRIMEILDDLALFV